MVGLVKFLTLVATFAFHLTLRFFTVFYSENFVWSYVSVRLRGHLTTSLKVFLNAFLPLVKVLYMMSTAKF